MKIILFVLLAYYLFQLGKPKSFSKALFNHCNKQMKEAKSKEDEAKEGCLGFIVLIPFMLIKMTITFFLLWVVIDAINKGVMLYPSIFIGVWYILMWVGSSIKSSKAMKKDKNSDIKESRSVLGWINLILMTAYVVWYLIVI